VSEVKQKLTLDRPAIYQIKVPGQLNERWSHWNEGMVVSVENDNDGHPISSLTCTVDQAALQGLLRRLYSSGLPLISVDCLEVKQSEI